MAGNESTGGSNREQNKNVRASEGFGDDMGTRVGRPDAPNRAGDGMARLSEDVDDTPQREEGSILDGDVASSQGGRSHTRADGSSMEASSRPGSVNTTGGSRETLDHTQRAESGMSQRGGQGGASASGADSGMGGEANRGVHAEQGRGASVERGTDEGAGTNAGGASGSEPLEGRKSEHKGSYGGEGGEARTSSDQREGPGSGKK